MKTQIIVLFVLFFCFNSCKKADNENVAKINFSAGHDASDIIVRYNEIIGYDSTKYVFRLKESAWKKLQSKITPMYPDPQFGFSVMLDKQIIYSAQFVPFYHSASRRDIITFILLEPDLVYITLGYPSSPDLFMGEDLRNDVRIIRQLKADIKLIEIDD